MPWLLYPQEGDLIPIIQEAGLVPGSVRMDVENLPPSECDPQTLWPIASCSADYAGPPHKKNPL